MTGRFHLRKEQQWQRTKWQRTTHMDNRSTTTSKGHGPIVEVTDVHKSFGDVHALAGASLSIEAGTVYGLLGANGAGKTTLINVLSTLIPPDRGTATVGGIDVTNDPQASPPPGRSRRPVRRRRRLPDRSRERRDGRSPVRAQPPRRAASSARCARPVQPVRRRRPQGVDLLGRHAPPARSRRVTRRPTRGAVPRRADDRHRSRAVASTSGS